MSELPPAVEQALSLLPAELAGTLAAVREKAAAEFEGQFMARPERVRACLGLGRMIRRALGELCWPAPSLRGRKTISVQIGELSRRGPQQDLAPPEPEAEANGVRRQGDRMEFPTLHAACEWLARMIAQLPATMPPIINAAHAQPLTIPDARGELIALWRAQPRLRPLVGLVENLEKGLPAGVTPILFGSLAADRAWLEYNDVDLALLLPAQIDAAALVRLIETMRAQAPLITRVDPLQHHGPFILFEHDFKCWLPSYLPLQTFASATVLAGAARSEGAVVLRDRVLALDALLGAYDGARRLAVDPRHLTDRYVGKFAASLALLVPALYCGAMSRPVEKGASFAIFMRETKPNIQRAVQTLERFRREWDLTLNPPGWALDLAGERAHALARNFNRLPSARLARLMGVLHPLIDELFTQTFETLAERLPQ